MPSTPGEALLDVNVVIAANFRRPCGERGGTALRGIAGSAYAPYSTERILLWSAVFSTVQSPIRMRLDLGDGLPIRLIGRRFIAARRRLHDAIYA